MSVDLISDLTDAAVEALVAVVSSTFMDDAERHAGTRLKGEQLRTQAAIQGILSPALRKVVGAITGEVTRRTAVRAIEFYAHPTFSSDANII